MLIFVPACLTSCFFFFFFFLLHMISEIPSFRCQNNNIKRFLFLSFLLHLLWRRRWRRRQGSALAVESRAAPTTVHELQPHQSVLTSSSSAVTNNRRVVVVSNSSKGASGGGSSEYQLQFAWPSTVNKSIKKMPESLDGVFQLGQQHHHHHHHQSNNNNNGNYRLLFCLLITYLHWASRRVLQKCAVQSSIRVLRRRPLRFLLHKTTTLRQICTAEKESCKEAQGFEPQGAVTKKK